MGVQDVTPHVLPPMYPCVTLARASTCDTEAATNEEAPERETPGVAVLPAKEAGMGMQHITVTSGQAATGTSSRGRCGRSRMAGTTQVLRPRCTRALNWHRGPQGTGGSPQCLGTPGLHGGIYPMNLRRELPRGYIP